MKGYTHSTIHRRKTLKMREDTICEETYSADVSLSAARRLSGSAHPYLRGYARYDTAYLDSYAGLVGYAGPATQAHHRAGSRTHPPACTYGHGDSPRTDCAS